MSPRQQRGFNVRQVQLRPRDGERHQTEGVLHPLRQPPQEKHVHQKATHDRHRDRDRGDACPSLRPGKDRAGRRHEQCEADMQYERDAFHCEFLAEGG